MILLATLMALTPPPVDDALARARVCYEALDFECVEQYGQLAITGDPAGRVEAARLLAQSALATDKVDLADKRLAALLALKPDFEPKAWPKAWIARLEAARAAAPDRQPPELTVRIPLTAAPKTAFDVVAITKDKSGVAGVKLFVGGQQGPIAMATTDGTTWRATVPASAVVGDAVGLWVEATDRLGNGPARFGTWAKPRLVQLETPGGDDSLTSQWWFWTAIGGAVAVAAATGVTVWALTQKDDAIAPPLTPPGETGNLKVGVPAWFKPSD